MSDENRVEINESMKGDYVAIIFQIIVFLCRLVLIGPSLFRHKTYQKKLISMKIIIRHFIISIPDSLLAVMDSGNSFFSMVCQSVRHLFRKCLFLVWKLGGIGFLGFPIFRGSGASSFWSGTKPSRVVRSSR